MSIKTTTYAIEIEGQSLADINKHGHHRPFLFLIDLFLKIFSSETVLPNELKLGRKQCEKLTDDRRRMPSDGKSSHCLWQGELKMLITCHMLKPDFCLSEVGQV
jgi:hypothetical protein